MSSTVRELAALVGGEVHGDGDLRITAARPLGDAGPGDITFSDRDKPLTDLHASAAVVGPGFVPNGKPLIRVADPFAAFRSVRGLSRSEKVMSPGPASPRG